MLLALYKFEALITYFISLGNLKIIVFWGSEGEMVPSTELRKKGKISSSWNVSFISGPGVRPTYD
jgi:hypothetical protein